MKRFLTFLLFASPLFGVAQQSAAAVLAAEKRFAAYSVRHGTKAAFLQFADSSGLVFEHGKAVNAIETWNGREARPGVLNWYPIYGWMAASGDLGFTSGPWTFQPKTSSDSIVARGQYNTVWHKTASGEWKFLLDMGIARTPNFETATFQFSDKKITYTPGTLDDLLKAEEAFILRTSNAAQRRDAYVAAISKEAFLINRTNQLPVTTINAMETLLTSMPQSIVYKAAGAAFPEAATLVMCTAPPSSTTKTTAISASGEEKERVVNWCWKCCHIEAQSLSKLISLFLRQFSEP